MREEHASRTVPMNRSEMVDLFLMKADIGKVARWRCARNERGAFAVVLTFFDHFRLLSSPLINILLTNVGPLPASISIVSVQTDCLGGTSGEGPANITRRYTVETNRSRRAFATIIYPFILRANVTMRFSLDRPC